MDSSVTADIRRASLSPAAAERSNADTYDAITDLFLGEVGRPVMPGAGAIARPPGGPTHIEGPMRLAGTDATTSPPKPRERGPALIEGVVVSHLPTLAGVWVMQYARGIALDEDRAVGVIHLVDERCDIEVVTPETQAEWNKKIDGRTDAAKAIAEVSREIGRWIVRLDARHEAQLGTSIDVHAVTILSGCDPAAVSGAFRSIRTMFVAGLGRRGDGPGAAQPELGVVLVGADHAAAQAAGERICSTASLLLGMPVRVTGRLECIESPRAGATAYAARDARTAELIDALRLALGPAPLVRESRKIEPPPSAPRRDVLPTIAGVTPSPASAPASAVTAPSTAEHAAAAKRVESRLIHAAASLGTPNTAGLKRLEAMLMLAANVPGLRPIVARCPYAEPIGLALDAAGGCHLLATADEATAAGVVTDMGRTRDWVRDHVELIRLTLPPGTALDAEADPEMHVFVREGRGVSRLLRQGVRVHVAMSATDEDALDVPRYIEIT